MQKWMVILVIFYILSILRLILSSISGFSLKRRLDLEMELTRLKTKMTLDKEKHMERIESLQLEVSRFRTQVTNLQSKLAKFQKSEEV